MPTIHTKSFIVKNDASAIKIYARLLESSKNGAGVYHILACNLNNNTSIIDAHIVGINFLQEYINNALTKNENNLRNSVIFEFAGEIFFKKEDSSIIERNFGSFAKDEIDLPQLNSNSNDNLLLNILQALRDKTKLINELQAEKSDFQDSIEALSENISKHQKEIVELKAIINANKNKIASNTKLSIQKFAQSGKEINSLKEELKNSKETNSQLQNQLQAQEQIINNLKQENESLKHVKNDKNKEITTLNEKLKNYHDVNPLKLELNSINNKLKEQLKNNLKFNIENKKLETEIEQLKTTLHEIQAKYQAANNANNNLQAENSVLKQQLEISKQEIASTASKLENSANELRQKEQQINSYKSNFSFNLQKCGQLPFSFYSKFNSDIHSQEDIDYHSHAASSSTNKINKKK
jgi:chromosome segregation ATPase